MSTPQASRVDWANEIEKFDPSDNYHLNHGELDARSYYAALDRVVALLDGRIHAWTDPHPPSPLGPGQELKETR